MTAVPLVTQHTIVGMAARGRRTQDIADRTALPLAVVRGIAERYGAPDLGKLAWSADELRRQLDAQIIAEAKTEREEAPAKASGSARKTSGGITAATGLDLLLAEAERIESARLASRARDLMRRLDQLRTDVDAAGKAYDAQADRRAKLARLAELKAEEAKLRAELKGSVPAKSPAASTASATPPKAIREWAAAAGLTCPAMGPIPAAVREQHAKAVR